MLILYIFGIIFAIFIALIVCILIMVRKDKDTFSLASESEDLKENNLKQK